MFTEDNEDNKEKWFGFTGPKFNVQGYGQGAGYSVVCFVWIWFQVLFPKVKSGMKMLKTGIQMRTRTYQGNSVLMVV